MARAGRSYPARPILGHLPLTAAPQPGPPPPVPPVPITFQAWPPQGAWFTGEIQGQWVAGAPITDDQALPPRPFP